MGLERHYRFSRSRVIDNANRHVGDAQRARVIMNRSGAYDGPEVEVEGRTLQNFGSCSYLGLETHAALKQATVEAVQTYGTQLSFSRAFLESPLYAELESLLDRITGGHTMVSPTTTLGHIAALPVLVRDGDAVLVDQFAHASLHTAVELLHDVPVRLLRHNRLDRLEEQVRKLAETHGRVWYVMDGLYSMRGDFAPFEQLRELLDALPMLHLYIDDAHSTSWHGQHGRGAALDALGIHERVIVALSLNKAFSAAGGALVLPDPELRTLIRRCGGPMLFSGPVQPPMLGAAVASARLHLAPTFPQLQQEVMVRIDHALHTLAERGVQLTADTRTPIFMVPCDSPRIVFDATLRLREAGYYVCPSVFPAVPINQPGIRFTITRHNDLQTIDGFAEALADALAGARQRAREERESMRPPAVEFIA